MGTLGDALHRVLAATSTPGAVIAVRDDRGLTTYPIGFTDLARQKSIAADAVFPLYSITKTYLAVLVLQLAEQKRLDLDASASCYVAAPGLDQRITVRHLLRHTAGLADYGGVPAYHDALRQHSTVPWTNSDYFAAAFGDDLQYPPGEGWAYANVGYLLLRLMIEQVTAQPWDVVLADQVLAPLGQRQTRVLTTAADLQSVTPGFTKAGPGPECSWLDARSSYHPGWVSHGLLAATAAEVATMFAVLFGTTRLIGAASQQAMQDKVVVPGASDDMMRSAGYGLGVMLYEHPAVGAIAGHNGAGPGWSTSAMHAVRVGSSPITVVTLANSDEAIAPQLAFTALQHVTTPHEPAEQGCANR